eukprot:gene45375-56523_t
MGAMESVVNKAQGMQARVFPVVKRVDFPRFARMMDGALMTAELDA